MCVCVCAGADACVCISLLRLREVLLHRVTGSCTHTGARLSLSISPSLAHETDQRRERNRGERRHGHGHALCGTCASLQSLACRLPRPLLPAIATIPTGIVFCLHVLLACVADSILHVHVRSDRRTFMLAPPLGICTSTHLCDFILSCTGICTFCSRGAAGKGDAATLVGDRRP